MDAALDYGALTERAMADLRAKTDVAIGLFHFDECRWDVDQDAGTIAFIRENGVRASAPVQIIGTFNPEDGTWLWAWDHPSVRPPLRKAAETLKAYGAAHGIAELTTARLDCREEDCWRFTALACHLSEAQGGYRGPTGGPLVFMTYGMVTLSKATNGTAAAEA
jgi:Family of unknown function (DUF6882)